MHVTFGLFIRYTYIRDNINNIVNTIRDSGVMVLKYYTIFIIILRNIAQFILYFSGNLWKLLEIVKNQNNLDHFVTVLNE